MRRDDPTLSMFFDQILYFINFIIVKRTGKLLQAISTGKARLWKLIGHFFLWLKAESIAPKSYLWENLVLWHPILIVILDPFTEPLVSGGPFSAKNQNRILWGTWSHLIMEKKFKDELIQVSLGAAPPQLWKNKTIDPALSSGPQKILPVIWGHHHQVDDQHKEPMIDT